MRGRQESKPAVGGEDRLDGRRQLVMDSGGWSLIFGIPVRQANQSTVQRSSIRSSRERLDLRLNFPKSRKLKLQLLPENMLRCSYRNRCLYRDSFPSFLTLGFFIKHIPLGPPSLPETFSHLTSDLPRYSKFEIDQWCQWHYWVQSPWVV
jgi:hypothetical protein